VSREGGGSRKEEVGKKARDATGNQSREIRLGGEMRAYHFLKRDMTTGFGNEPPWRKGETRRWKGECVLCESGYHSSPTWLDAVLYAAGPIACIVDVSRPVRRFADKQVSRRRTLIDYRDATRVLYLFACECAEHILKAEGVTDEAAWNILSLKRQWVDGKVSDEELTAAWHKAKPENLSAIGDEVVIIVDEAGCPVAWANTDVTGWAVSCAAKGNAVYAAAFTAWLAAWPGRHVVPSKSGEVVRMERAESMKVRETERAWQSQRLDEMMAELFKNEQ